MVAVFVFTSFLVEEGGLVVEIFLVGMDFLVLKQHNKQQVVLAVFFEEADDVRWLLLPCNETGFLPFTINIRFNSIWTSIGSASNLSAKDSTKAGSCAIFSYVPFNKQ